MIDGYAVTFLASPVTLEAETEYRIAQDCWSGMDLWVNGGNKVLDSSDATVDSISYTGAVYGSSESYPGTTDGVWNRAGMLFCRCYSFEGSCSFPPLACGPQRCEIRSSLWMPRSTAFDVRQCVSGDLGCV